MASLLALMDSTVKGFITSLFTAVLASLGKGAWRSLAFFATEALDWHIDSTRRTATRMAQNVTSSMLTVFVPLLITVLTTRVRQDQRRERWLIVSSTETQVPWHVVLSVAEVAVGTCP